ncbi:MAG: hypothetical protein JWM99_4918 [Verrucomicrobiales bacterium]|nr:hypothetical protein [Verrucomicrobiales bacterium]
MSFGLRRDNAKEIRSAAKLVENYQRIKRFLFFAANLKSDRNQLFKRWSTPGVWEALDFNAVQSIGL